MPESLDKQSDVSLRAARALSKILFGGAQYRLAIGAEIASLDLDSFNASELAQRTGISKQSVSYELGMLEDAGLIQRLESVDKSARKVFYTRVSSAYWAWCSEGAAQAAEMLSRKPRY